MPLPFISVVVPLYNKAQSFPLTAASVMAQTYRNFEVVIVDDGSTDDSLAVARSLGDDRFTIVHQANGGVSVARNRGVSEAKSDYIAFLDADDLWDPEHLATLAGLIERYPDAVMWATSYRTQYTDGSSAPAQLHSAVRDLPCGLMPNYFEAATFGEQPFYTSSVCVRKETQQRIGGFRERLAHGEDMEVWARLALSGPVSFSSTPTVTYRLESENRAMNRWPALKAWPFDEAAYDRLAEGAPPAIAREDVFEHIARVNLYTVSSNRFNPDSKSVLEFLRGIKTERFKLRKLTFLILFSLPAPLRSHILKAKNRKRI